MNIITALNNVSRAVSRDQNLRALGLTLIINGMIERRTANVIAMQAMAGHDPKVVAIHRLLTAHQTTIDLNLQAAANFEQEVGGLLTILFDLETENPDFQISDEERRLLTTELGRLLGILGLEAPASQEAEIELYTRFSHREFTQLFFDRSGEYQTHIERTRVQPGDN